jgi:hypothetical protein
MDVRGRVAVTHQEYIPRYSLYRRLVVSHKRSGRYGEEKNLAPAGAIQPIARPYTD